MSYSTYYFRTNSLHYYILQLYPLIILIPSQRKNHQSAHSNSLVCIINTDPCDEPGSHWVAVFIKINSEADIFHSYGLLSLNEDLVTKLKFFSHVEFNTTTLQGFSTVCGQYCLVYLLLRSRGFSLKKIVKLLSIVTITEERDHIIGEVINLTYHELL